MSTTYTPNTKLGQPALGDTGWSTPLNANCTTLDGLSPVGGLCVTTYEQPSASLNVAVAAGNYVKQDGTIATYAGAASQAVTASATNYLYLDLTELRRADGQHDRLSDDRARMRLAVVVAGSSTITSVTDSRLAFTACGSVLDGTELAVGSTSGLMIGTADYAEARILWQDARRTADDGRRDRGVVHTRRRSKACSMPSIRRCGHGAGELICRAARSTSVRTPAASRCGRCRSRCVSTSRAKMPRSRVAYTILPNV